MLTYFEIENFRSVELGQDLVFDKFKKAYLAFNSSTIQSVLINNPCSNRQTLYNPKNPIMFNH
jgi:hypothetical protein